MFDPQDQFLASAILGVVAVYTAIGIMFATIFLAGGVTRVDPAATGSRWHFRLLIWPGVVVLWPVMMVKWIRRTTSGSAQSQALSEDV